MTDLKARIGLEPTLGSFATAAARRANPALMALESRGGPAGLMSAVGSRGTQSRAQTKRANGHRGNVGASRGLEQCRCASGTSVDDQEEDRAQGGDSPGYRRERSWGG